MGVWNPWRGCHRYSEGCKYCYIHKGDARRGVDTNLIHKTKDFYKPIEKLNNGEWKMKSGFSYLCFQSDFLLEDADEWRKECWEMIHTRSDIKFLFLTKRIDRFMECIPKDWNDGYDNVIVCCTIENQEAADYRLPIFQKLPIKHKLITAQPLLEDINIEPYLDGIESVTVGGESDKEARPLYFDWVLHIREQCIRKQVDFDFRQLGTHFIKDGVQYTIPIRELCKQARKAEINVQFKK